MPPTPPTGRHLELEVLALHASETIVGGRCTGIDDLHTFAGTTFDIQRSARQDFANPMNGIPVGDGAGLRRAAGRIHPPAVRGSDGGSVRRAQGGAPGQLKRRRPSASSTATSTVARPVRNPAPLRSPGRFSPRRTSRPTRFRPGASVPLPGTKRPFPAKFRRRKCHFSHMNADSGPSQTRPDSTSRLHAPPPHGAAERFDTGSLRVSLNAAKSARTDQNRSKTIIGWLALDQRRRSPVFCLSLPPPGWRRQRNFGLRERAHRYPAPSCRSNLQQTDALSFPGQADNEITAPLVCFVPS